MCSDIAIEVRDLSKCFNIYEKSRDRLLQMLHRGKKRYFREFWALRNVSFTVRKGETVGIVGRNGSGKSTLLQIICGTLNPSGGSVQTNGRIAALLELGSGFNPEFTGRENVYLNAAVLGLSRGEIDQRFAAIEAFAEIGDFIDQPVKTYSSGMMVRLAFAVAINVEPQILIVDEALSVGDELFQRKCYARIEEIKKSGATILFVSHSGSTVIDLCDRAILMDSGSRLTEGAPKSVIGQYQKLLYAPGDKVAEIRSAIAASDGGISEMMTNAVRDNGTIDNHASLDDFYDPHMKSSSTLSYESHGVEIQPPKVLDLTGRQVNCLIRGRLYRYSYQARFDTSATNVRFGMMIRTIAGIDLGGATSAAQTGDSLGHVPRDALVDVTFEFHCDLNPGTYFFNAGVQGSIGDNDTYLHRLLDACMFKVLPISNNLSTGVVDFKCVPEVRLVKEKVV